MGRPPVCGGLTPSRRLVPCSAVVAVVVLLGTASYPATTRPPPPPFGHAAGMIPVLKISPTSVRLRAI